MPRNSDSTTSALKLIKHLVVAITLTSPSPKNYLSDGVSCFSIAIAVSHKLRIYILGIYLRISLLHVSHEDVTILLRVYVLEPYYAPTTNYRKWYLLLSIMFFLAQTEGVLCHSAQFHKKKWMLYRVFPNDEYIFYDLAKTTCTYLYHRVFART